MKIKCINACERYCHGAWNKVTSQWSLTGSNLAEPSYLAQTWSIFYIDGKIFVYYLEEMIAILTKKD